MIRQDLKILSRFILFYFIFFSIGRQRTDGFRERRPYNIFLWFSWIIVCIWLRPFRLSTRKQTQKFIPRVSFAQLTWRDADNVVEKFGITSARYRLVGRTNKTYMNGRWNPKSRKSGKGEHHHHHHQQQLNFELRGEDERSVKRESIYGQSRTRKTKMAIKLVLNFILFFWNSPSKKKKKNVQKENERKTPTDCY